ncbi:MAG: efflux RND transporter periplasmic adaptor subunit [Armatimonadia bacterium]|nr:efflux RND transporter periplasmic adaptor subunit [Armatimonadia bacterium]
MGTVAVWRPALTHPYNHIVISGRSTGLAGSPWRRRITGPGEQVQKTDRVRLVRCVGRLRMAPAIPRCRRQVYVHQRRAWEDCPMRRELMRVAGALVMAAGLATALVVAGCGGEEAHGPQEAHKEPVAVETTTASLEGVAEYTTVSGRVQPLMRAELAANVMARVRQVTVTEGTRVEAGEVLVRLDADRASAEASRARAGVMTARAALEQAKLQSEIQDAASETGLTKAEQDLRMAESGARTEEKIQADEALRQAEADVAKAEEMLDMLREGARVQERAQARQAVDRAQARVEQARQGLDAMLEGARPQEREQARQAVEQAEAALRTAQSKLEEVEDQRRAQMQAKLATAEAAFETADATFQRMEALYEAEVISEQRFDEAKLAHQTALNQLTMARQEASLFDEGPDGEAVAMAREAVRQAEAGVVQAREQASLVEEGPRRQEVEAARQEVAAAEAALAQAEQQASLVEEGPRTQEIRQAEEALRQAEAQVEIARQQREMAYAGARPEELEQVRSAYELAVAGLAEADIAMQAVEAAQAQVAFAAAAARAAEVMVDDHIIRAPFGGVVVGRSVDPGDLASPGMVLVTIEPDSMFRLHCQVPERMLGHLSLGQGLPVTLDSLPDEDVTGEVSSITPAADPATGTALVKVDLLPNEHMRSGMFGRLHIPVAKGDTVLIPKSAVWSKESLTGAWVVADGRARLRFARLGRERDGQVEVLSGIVAGDEIIVDAPATLEDGDPVTTPGGGAEPEVPE